MVRHRLAGHQPQRSPTPSAYRAGNEGKPMGQGASLATFADPLLQRQSSRRSTSDGKQWQENPRGGPRNLGSERETVTPPDGMGVLIFGDSGYTRQDERDGLEQSTGLAGVSGLPARNR